MSRIVLDELDPQDLEYEMDLQIDSDGQTPKHPGHRHVLVPWSVQGNLNPPEIVRGQGSYFFDSSGNRYLDLTSGFVAVSLGHGHPHVIKPFRNKPKNYVGSHQATIMTLGRNTPRKSPRSRHGKKVLVSILQAAERRQMMTQSRLQNSSRSGLKFCQPIVHTTAVRLVRAP